MKPEWKDDATAIKNIEESKEARKKKEGGTEGAWRRERGRGREGREGRGWEEREEGDWEKGRWGGEVAGGPGPVAGAPGGHGIHKKRPGTSCVHGWKRMTQRARLLE